MTIRIRIKVKSRIRFRGQIKVTEASSPKPRSKVKNRIRILVRIGVKNRITLQRYCTKTLNIGIFPEMERRGHSPNSYIQVSLCDLYIATIGLHILL
jgi:hypothetical protein